MTGVNFISIQSNFEMEIEYMMRGDHVKFEYENTQNKMVKKICGIG